MRIDSTLVGSLVALALAASVQAQGLGDAAQREAERRKAAQQKAAPVKTYTDQDLPSSQVASPVAEEAPEDTAEAGQEAEGAPQGGGVVIGGLPMASSDRTVKPPRTRDSSTSESESYGQNPGSEAGWRAAASSARRKIAAAEARVQELDKKAAGLIYAPPPGAATALRPDGGCIVDKADGHITREELKKLQCPDSYLQWQSERKRTLDALDQAKGDVEKARKDLDALAESARRQGAPPGWLRE